MKKKLLCFVLSMVLLFSTYSQIFAVSDDTVRINISKDNYMEISVDASDDYNSHRNNYSCYVIRHYIDNKLVQKVSVEAGNNYMLVENYERNSIVSKQLIDISERVTLKKSSVFTLESGRSASATLVNGNLLGYITYKPAKYSGDIETIQVYNNLINFQNEAYTINGKASDTLAVVTGLIVGVLVTVFTYGMALSIGAEIAIAIISGFGGSVLGGAIGASFSEDVSVTAYHYEMFGYDYQTFRSTSVYPGVSRKVNTSSSNYYEKWFYEGITPATWQDLSYAYYFWCDLFDSNLYSGVSSWS